MRASPPPRVDWPVMYHRWSDITFIHWRYPPAVVQRLLPPCLTVETFDGTAWVGLTPFLMEDVRTPGVPPLPWLSRFPETNLRTYVRDARGRGGLWFLSLDAGCLPAVLAARAGYWLPYFWSDMSVRVDGEQIGYRCRRRWPGPSGARWDADVETGPPLAEAEHDELAHFLTARYRLFTVVAGRLAAAEVEHPPWPLRHVRLLALDQELLRAGGLPAPDHAPLLHGSAGVPVRVGMWSWSS
ncbi:YqjF family protein [Streptosporangium sp. NPDC000396]|uniref:YqjF family protein n=1 Tax=Streptosporangium sp. NPDC000396 TaxID=3366185 RepID=UPI00369A1145